MEKNYVQFRVSDLFIDLEKKSNGSIPLLTINVEKVGGEKENRSRRNFVGRRKQGTGGHDNRHDVSVWWMVRREGGREGRLAWDIPLAWYPIIKSEQRICHICQARSSSTLVPSSPLFLSLRFFLSLLFPARFYYTLARWRKLLEIRPDKSL